MPTFEWISAIKVYSTLGLALVYLYLFTQYRERYIGYWFISWALISIRLALDFFRFTGDASLVMLILNELTSILGPLFLLLAIYEFIDKKISKWWIYTCALAGLLTYILFFLNISLVIVIIPTSTYFGVAEIWSGILLLRFWYVKGLGRMITGYAFILTGINDLAYPFDAAIPSEYTYWALLICTILDIIIIIGTLLVYFEKTRKDLSDSEERFRLLAENAKDIVYRYTLTPHPAFEYISPAVVPVTGYTPQELYDKSDLIFKIVNPDDRSILENFRQSPDLISQPLILRLITKDGKRIWVEQQASPIYDHTGNLVAIEGIVRDITERKRIEQEMARLDQLRLIGEMAATITHEIRNPMATVQGYLHIFRSKDDLKQYNEYLAIMIDELDRANSIITDYLFLGKESNQNLLTQELNRIIQIIYPLIEACARGSSKSLKLELGDIPDLALDEKEIRQLLLNIAQNGLDSMPSGGVLKISTYMDNDEVVLEVQDQGGGIEPEALEKLGTPFFTTKEEGTGLGLAVCYNIAARHKAGITVDTGPGGTIFSVRFKQHCNF